MRRVFLLLLVIFLIGTIATACQRQSSLTPDDPTTGSERRDLDSSTGEFPEENEAANDDVITGGNSRVEVRSFQNQTPDGESYQESVINVIADNYSFSPNTITVNSGSRVTINLTSKAGMHDFVIDELGVNSGVVTAGKQVSLTIPTDKPGRYTYYCSMGSHRQMGQEGTLIIE